MAEQLKRDQNHVTVQGAVTDDVNQSVEMWRADATTKRLLVSAVVAGSQNGKILVDGADTTYEYLATKLVAGSGITLTVLNPGGNETLEIASIGSTYYSVVQEDGVSVTQRPRLNFVNYFSVSDNAGNTSSDIDLNISAIEASLDLANIGGQINLATQVTGLLSSTNIDITDLESNLNLSNIAGSIDLSTQVTGTLGVANIDVVGIANDATFLATLIPNLDENVKVAVDGVTVTGDGTTANPLVAVVSSDNFTVKATSADTTPSYLDNKINIHSTDGSVTVTKTITNPAGNEVVDYDLSVPSNTGGIVNTRTAISIFQDFCGDPINSGGGGTSITYGGLYPYTTRNSNAQRGDEDNHPGIIEFITGGSIDVGFSLNGLDTQNLSIEGMFYFDKTIPTNALVISLPSSFGGTSNFVEIYLKTFSGETYQVNGSTPASCTYISGWNTFKVLYNSAGTSTSFYLNGTLLGSSLPVSIAGSGGPTQGSDCKLDYLSVNATITR